MILGVDPGERRVGVAMADPDARFAHPLEVIDAKSTDPVARLAQIVAERKVTLVVVGLPVGLSGRRGPAVERQTEFLSRLRDTLNVPVDEFDERLTTVLAERGLRASGARQGPRRELRDAVAAQLMLQGYLDSRR
jgi:putative Holliday junction resolvase